MAKVRRLTKAEAADLAKVKNIAPLSDRYLEVLPGVTSNNRYAKFLLWLQRELRNLPQDYMAGVSKIATWPGKYARPYGVPLLDNRKRRSSLKLTLSPTFMKNLEALTSECFRPVRGKMLFRKDSLMGSPVFTTDLAERQYISERLIRKGLDMFDDELFSNLIFVGYRIQWADGSKRKVEIFDDLKDFKSAEQTVIFESNVKGVSKCRVRVYYMFGTINAPIIALMSGVRAWKEIPAYHHTHESIKEDYNLFPEHLTLDVPNFDFLVPREGIDLLEQRLNDIYKVPWISKLFASAHWNPKFLVPSPFGKGVPYYITGSVYPGLLSGIGFVSDVSKTLMAAEMATRLNLDPIKLVYHGYDDIRLLNTGDDNMICSSSSLRAKLSPRVSGAFTYSFDDRCGFSGLIETPKGMMPNPISFIKNKFIEIERALDERSAMGMYLAVQYYKENPVFDDVLELIAIGLQNFFSFDLYSYLAKGKSDERRFQMDQNFTKEELEVLVSEDKGIWKYPEVGEKLGLVKALPYETYEKWIYNI